MLIAGPGLPDHFSLASAMIVTQASKNMNKTIQDLTRAVQSLNAKSQQQPASGQSKSARRRRARNNKMQSQPEKQYGPQSVFTSGPVSQTLFTRKNRRDIGANIPMGNLSDAGLAFLRSTFAAPDFAGQGAFKGIPDNKTYFVTPFRHILAGNLFTLLGITGLEPSQQLVIAQFPTPGVAFWWTITTGAVEPSSIFTPVPFDQFETLFNNPIDTGSSPPVNINKNVNSFRMSGNSIELICTSNATSWNGSIRAFKGNVNMTDCKLYSPNGGWTNYQLTKCITGLENINATGAASFISPSNLGVYMTAVNKEVVFNSHEVPDSMADMNGNNDQAFGVLGGTFTGFGDLETNFIILEGTATATVQTQFSVRAWQAVEYTPINSSLLYSSATSSPKSDPAALEIYRSLVSELPVAVTYFENGNFWKRLLSLTSRIGGALKVLPGPMGLIAGGVGDLASNIGTLVN